MFREDFGNGIKDKGHVGSMVVRKQSWKQPGVMKGLQFL